MLKSLSIRNFAVIERLDLEFGPGLQVLTGETGAGKSIVVEALGFLLGDRGSSDWLRKGEAKLEVSGVIDGRAVSRELDATGRSRARIDGKPASAAQLSELGEALADFHGQHEHQTLLKPARQLDLLDRHADLWPLREKIAKAYRDHEDLRRRLEAMRLSEDERLRRIDLCRFQLEEIDKVAPKAGEEEELEALLPKLQNAERLLEAGAELHGALYEAEGAAAEDLSRAARAAEELARLDPEAEEIAKLVREAKTLTDEAASRVSDYRGRLEADPERLDEVLGRQDKLSKLRKKYGPSLHDVLEHRERMAEELSALENHEEASAELDKLAAKALERLEALADEAHDARVAAGKRLAAQVSKELQPLGMDGARFSVSVEMDEGQRTPSGSDRVEFLIAANPGEPAKPLRAVASGGEMSRIMLALKTVLSKADKVPVLVFDEVDAGVGGAVARAVGKRLAGLARDRQVLVVTHLPQVACYADSHFHVAKKVEQGRTRAAVERLEEKTRLQEMARLLGGDGDSAVSRKHAKELIEAARKELAGI